jgi:hypothetical protein
MRLEQWLVCPDVDEMLSHLSRRFRELENRRKTRLFLIACCRRIWDQLPGEYQDLLEWEELYVDRKAHADKWNRALEKVENLEPADKELRCLLDGYFEAEFDLLCLSAARIHAIRAKAKKFEAAVRAEQRRQASVLRHIFGNPFRPYPAPAHWPATVIQLAEALYAGQDCGFALHDALVEAGHAELAEHFRQEQWHPKGCWVVDLLLGKK